MKPGEKICYQRGILSGLLIESNIPDENNQRFDYIEDILKNKFFLFTEIQINVLVKAHKIIIDARKEGCFSCWVISDAFYESLDDIEKIEFEEIQSTGAIIVENISYYMKHLYDDYRISKLI